MQHLILKGLIIVDKNDPLKIQLIIYLTPDWSINKLINCPHKFIYSILDCLIILAKNDTPCLQLVPS